MEVINVMIIDIIGPCSVEAMSLCKELSSLVIFCGPYRPVKPNSVVDLLTMGIFQPPCHAHLQLLLTDFKGDPLFCNDQEKRYATDIRLHLSYKDPFPSLSVYFLPAAVNDEKGRVHVDVLFRDTVHKILLKMKFQVETCFYPLTDCPTVIGVLKALMKMKSTETTEQPELKKRRMTSGKST